MQVHTYPYPGIFETKEKQMIQNYILLLHGVIFVLLYCIKDDRIYTAKEQKRLNIATWVVGVPYVIFVAIFTVYLSQYNY